MGKIYVLLKKVVPLHHKTAIQFVYTQIINNSLKLIMLMQHFSTKIGLILLLSFCGHYASAQNGINPQTQTTQPDPAVIQKLHDLQFPIDVAKAYNDTEAINKAQAIYNEYAALHLLEARIVADQKEQAEAARNLSPAEYDAWKSNKYNPQNQNR